MRTAVNRFVARRLARLLHQIRHPPIARLAAPYVALWLGFALLAAAPAPAAEGERGREEERGDAWPAEDRWVPSFALFIGVTVQGQSGSVGGDCRDPDTGALTLCNPLRPDVGSVLADAADDDLAVTAVVDGSVQLMSPVLSWLPGRPRLFFGGEIPLHFAQTRNVAQDGSPSIPITEPELPGVVLANTEQFTEEGLQGVGSATRAEVDRLAFGASAGLAFPFEVWGRRLRLKASAGWIRYKIDVEGIIARAFCPPVQNPAFDSNEFFGCDLDGVLGAAGRSGRPDMLSFTQSVELRANDSQWFDGVGPGLELEMDTGRVGPLGVSLFAGAQAYYVFTDRRVELSTSQTFDEETFVTPDGNRSFTYPAFTSTARWRFSVDPWVYRAGVGIRFHWLGRR